MAIFGNHSPTMVPYLEFATSKGKKVKDLVDKEWMAKTFFPGV
jgi:malate/lactate dehydrogenase